MTPPADASRAPNSAAERRAFTLIELLAVIAVIAILAAILFPALGTANEKARQSKCMSNLRSWGQGLALYLATTDGVFPEEGIESLAGADPGKSNAWYNTVPYAMGAETLSNLCAVVPGKPRRTPRPPADKSLFTCPSYKAADVPATIPSSLPVFSYGYNLWIDHANRAAENAAPYANNSGFGTLLRMSQITRPSKFVAWGEGSGATFDNLAGRNLVFRHRGTSYVNIVFVDGHVMNFFWTNVFVASGAKNANTPPNAIWNPEGAPSQYDNVW